MTPLNFYCNKCWCLDSFLTVIVDPTFYEYHLIFDEQIVLWCSPISAIAYHYLVKISYLSYVYLVSEFRIFIVLDM